MILIHNTGMPDNIQQINQNKAGTPEKSMVIRKMMMVHLKMRFSDTIFSSDLALVS